MYRNIPLPRSRTLLPGRNKNLLVVTLSLSRWGQHCINPTKQYWIWTSLMHIHSYNYNIFAVCFKHLQTYMGVFTMCICKYMCMLSHCKKPNFMPLMASTFHQLRLCILKSDLRFLKQNKSKGDSLNVCCHVNCTRNIVLLAPSPSIVEDSSIR